MTTDHEAQQLQQHIQNLQARCERLEAQNILVSVQQLDLLARGTALVLSLATYVLYSKLAFFAIHHYANNHHHPNNHDESSHVTTIMVMAGKLLLLLAPLVHHRRTHGLAFRRFEVFAIFFIVLARMKMCRWRERIFASHGTTSSSITTTTTTSFGESTSEDAIWDANYEISARFLYISILRLKGLWTKTAQYLSSRSDFMPPSYTRELKKLQDEAPATDWKHVQSMIPQKVKDMVDIEETPIASASIGQVHVAKHKKTGEKLVVKVQHPFARTLMIDDFWSLKVICKIIKWLEPEYAFMEILMGEWAKESRKELDFRVEVSNLRDAAACIRDMKTNRVLTTNTSEHMWQSYPYDVEIPVPLEELCTSDVLVMSFCDGKRIDDMDHLVDCHLPKTAVMDALSQTFAYMMYVGDLFNGDPHPGNIFVRKGTETNTEEGFTLVLLDWGLAKRLTERKRLAFCQMAYAASTFDYGLMLDAFQTIGLRMKRENVAEDMEGLRFLLRDMVPHDISRKRIKAKIKTDVERSSARSKGDRVPVESKAYPGEFFFFVRVNELLHGLGSRFGIELHYLDIIRPYAELGLRQFPEYSPSKLPQKSSYGTHRSKDVALLRKVSDVIDSLKEEKEIAGVQVCALDRDGDILIEYADGHLGGLKNDQEMTSDSLVLGYSCTKAIVSTIAHIMVIEGYLELDEPVCERVWKQFCPTPDVPTTLHAALGISSEEASTRWKWKRMITLRHILTHTSGLWSALPARMSVKSMANCEECVAAFSYNPDVPEDTLLPTHEPGAKCEYHFMSFGWLAAGTVCGAYAKRHGLKAVTFEDVYRAILWPKLSTATHDAGFRPLGGGGDQFPVAFTETASFDTTRLLQLQRESEAMGEKVPEAERQLLTSMMSSFQGKEFLLDQRIWNCEYGLNANCPAAGGRFSATGLARFYHDLGRGTILDSDTWKAATSEAAIAESFLQGQTHLSDGVDEDPDDSAARNSFGLGYQLIRVGKDSSSVAVGHAGVGGSIGFHHPESGVSVAVMLNKADGNKNTAAKIIRTLSDHLEF